MRVRGGDGGGEGEESRGDDDGEMERGVEEELVDELLEEGGEARMVTFEEEGIGVGWLGRLKVSCFTRRKAVAMRSQTGPPCRIQSCCRHSLEQYFATRHLLHDKVPNPLSQAQHNG